MRVKFWIRTSRGTNTSEIVEIDDDRASNEEEVKDMLTLWCIRVYPAFYISDARINYGWEVVDDS